jgi:thiamine phosphate synthase YjbQ (UPF0047 family)
MDATLTALELELRPTRRPEALDLRQALASRAPGLLSHGGAGRLLCISHHTTAGFLDRRLRVRVGSDPERLAAFLDALGTVFPPEAGYEHDQLHLRDELTPAEREREPLNADAHLAFIGGGFTNCTLARTEGSDPLWFIDLDGVFQDRSGAEVHRVRKATVVRFTDEEVVARIRAEVPMAAGPGVVRLDDPELDLLPRILAAIRSEGVASGRVQLHLDDPSRDAGITVNEFEALLMERDVARVLANPLDFAGSAIHAVSRLLEAVRISPRRLPRLLGRVLASPRPRVLRMQRELTLGVLPELAGAPGPTTPAGSGGLVLGTYQTPILVQRSGAPAGTRTLVATVRRFR